MTRRRLIGIAAAVLVVGANAAVWWSRTSGEAAPPPDRRRDAQRVIGADWGSLPTVTPEGATEAIRRALDEPGFPGAPAEPDGVGGVRSFRTLPQAERDDLIEAIGDAVAAIAGDDPRELFRYMRSRGRRLDQRLIAESLAGVQDAPSPREPAAQFAAVHDVRGIDPGWAAVAPDATVVRVWRPRSLYGGALIQLGRTEGWAWSNETVFPSVFGPPPSFEQASRDAFPLLADVRVLVEHDERLRGERSPYFFRFYRSDEAPTWRPVILKLVRTGDAPEGPTVLF